MDHNRETNITPLTETRQMSTFQLHRVSVYACLQWSSPSQIHATNRTSVSSDARPMHEPFSAIVRID